MPSAKSKPEQRDQKKQKSLLGWLSKPAAAKIAESSSAQHRVVVNASITSTSSSPGGGESIFETPSTKKRTALGASSSAVRSATFTRSSDGGRSVNDTPPTSDPIDVDMSSDEDLSRCEAKSVRDGRICALALTVIMIVSQAHTKRKMAIEDSDEEEGSNNGPIAHKNVSSAYRPSQPGKDNGATPHCRAPEWLTLDLRACEESPCNPFRR